MLNGLYIDSKATFSLELLSSIGKRAFKVELLIREGLTKSDIETLKMKLLHS